MASRLRARGQAGVLAMSDIVLLGCGHAHLSALHHWGSAPPPVVVTRACVESYSGLVPSVLRRERPTAGMHLARAVAAASGRLIVGECVSIDLTCRTLRLADGRTLDFGLLSLDLGAVSAAPPGAVAVRPATELLAAISRIEAGPPGAVAIVGAGAAGTELALALALRWSGGRQIVLFTSGPLLPDAPVPIRHRAERALRGAGVVIRAATASEIGPAGVATEDGGQHPAIAVLWAGGLAAPPLLRQAGLACDERGFVLVDRALRSGSHPFVFAVGDCAALGTTKSGALAVAAGRALPSRLAAVSAGHWPAPWQPPRHALAIIGIGHGRALAWRNRAWLAGRSAWWLKLWLDLRWVRRYGPTA